MNKKEQMKRTHEENWEKIDPAVRLHNPSVREHGICFPVSFKNVIIARLFCTGKVDFINEKKWKKGWEFKFDFGEDSQKFFYKYVGK